MNRIKKAGIIFLMAAMLCAGTAVPAFAKEAPQAAQTYVLNGEKETAFHSEQEGLSQNEIKALSEAPLYVAYEGDTGDITPFADYLSSASSNLTSSSGKLSLSGGYTSFSTNRIDLSLTLQYSTDGGSTWKNQQTWTKTYDPGKGSKIYSRTYSSPKKGYLYRNKTVATVKDSGGAALESFIVFSREITY